MSLIDLVARTSTREELVELLCVAPKNNAKNSTKLSPQW